MKLNLYGEVEYGDYKHMVDHPDSMLVPMHLDIILHGLCSDRKTDDLNRACIVLKTMHAEKAHQYFLKLENYTCAEIVHAYMKWKQDELPKMIEDTTLFWNVMQHNVAKYPPCMKVFVDWARFPSVKTVALRLLEHQASIPIKKMMLMMILKFCELRGDVAFGNDDDLTKPDPRYVACKHAADTLFQFIVMIRQHFVVSVRLSNTVGAYTKKRLRNWWLTNVVHGDGILNRRRVVRICGNFLFYYFAGVENERNRRVQLVIERPKA